MVTNTADIMDMLVEGPGEYFGIDEAGLLIDKTSRWYSWSYSLSSSPLRRRISC